MTRERFRLKSVLGPHSDHERPRLRHLVSAGLPERLPSMGTDPHTLAMRQQLARRVVEKSRAALMFHVEQAGHDGQAEA